jgi:hypothetical protein
MSKKRAFVRYSKQGKIVPGSLILTAGSHPNGPSTWKEVPADLCCDGGGTIRLTSVSFSASSNSFSLFSETCTTNTFNSFNYLGSTAEEWLSYFNQYFGWMGTFSLNPENPSQIFFDIKEEIAITLCPDGTISFLVGAA